jgi:spore cortex formation protein SpoVR/YcgB (stage V sporulation)
VDVDVRREAVCALSKALDKIDRYLLSQDLDGVHPFIDPMKTISNEFVIEAAKELGIKEGDVRSRYEALAKRYQLHIEWGK